MEEKSYLEWEPAIKIEDIFSDIVGIGGITVENNNIYWKEFRPAEEGRNVIMIKDKEGNEKELLPKPYNARTRVHEYGGKAYTVKNNIVYFANFNDQRIYKVENNKITPLTPERNKDGSLGKYASLNVINNKLVFVYELEYKEKQNKNCIAYIDLDSNEIKEPRIITEGRDFYGDIVTHNNQIAWQEWDLPYMPWEYTELFIAEFKNTLKNVSKVAGGKDTCICCPKFSPDGVLHFVMDSVAEEDSPKNWWNIYKYKNNVEPVTRELAEFGMPQWGFGASTYTWVNDELIALMIREGGEKLVKVETMEEVKSPFSGYGSFAAYGNDLVLTGIQEKKVGQLAKLDLNGEIETIKLSSHLEMKEKDISVAKHITYKTKNGKSYAYLYLPKNSSYKAKEGEKPPLLVMAHGGPTGGTFSGFSLVKQFWTSSGYAILDVNYTGSTGYGRKYRDGLFGLWGVIDAQDVADGVQYLIDQNTIDPNKVAVTGGSAGGYMVQRVLTEFPDLFKVGASYFGIGNLITLSEEGHKFESKYTDQLIDAIYPKDLDKFKDRSPINHLDKLKAPMIIFQGSDDKIVPPNCSREMAKILDDKGIKNKYYEYEGEAHGFRKKKNNIDSLTKEAAFYKEVFLK
jgi:dienelactone hydrolase